MDRRADCCSRPGIGSGILSRSGGATQNGATGGYLIVLLISNDPPGRRQRLADPSVRLTAGRAWLADAAHLVVARGGVAPTSRGWIEVTDIEKIDPFRLWDDDATVLAYNPNGPAGHAARRPDQQRFRERLMRAYGGRCAVTGCAAPELLDAAHLRPWRLGGEGILLRTDIHRMIDNGLASIRDGRLRLARPVSGYEQYDGAKVQNPRRAAR